MLSTVTGARLESKAITVLAALRSALEDCADLQSFMAALTPASFADLPLADAQAIFTAIADANALYRLASPRRPTRRPPAPTSTGRLRQPS